MMLASSIPSAVSSARPSVHLLRASRQHHVSLAHSGDWLSHTGLMGPPGFPFSELTLPKAFPPIPAKN